MSGSGLTAELVLGREVNGGRGRVVAEEAAHHGITGRRRQPAAGVTTRPLPSPPPGSLWSVVVLRRGHIV